MPPILLLVTVWLFNVGLVSSFETYVRGVSLPPDVISSNSSILMADGLVIPRCAVSNRPAPDFAISLIVCRSSVSSLDLKLLRAILPMCRAFARISHYNRFFQDALNYCALPLNRKVCSKQRLPTNIR